MLASVQVIKTLARNESDILGFLSRGHRLPALTFSDGAAVERVLLGAEQNKLDDSHFCLICLLFIFSDGMNTFFLGCF